MSVTFNNPIGHCDLKFGNNIYQSKIYFKEDRLVGFLTNEDMMNVWESSPVSKTVNDFDLLVALIVENDFRIGLYDITSNNLQWNTYTVLSEDTDYSISPTRTFTRYSRDGMVDYLTKINIPSLVFNGDVAVFSDVNNLGDFLRAYKDDQTVNPNQYGGSYGYNSDTPIITPDDSDEIADSDLHEYQGLGGSNNLFKLAVIDNTALNTIKTYLENSWLSGNVSNAIMSLKMIKTPSALNTSENQVIINGGTLGADTYGKIINKQFNLFDFGSYRFNRYFDNFLDYEPYTDISLYLPYAGIFPIKPNDVMNGSLSVKGIIDCITGNIVYYVTVTSNDGASGEGTNQTIYQFNGNCSYDMVLSSEDYGRKISGMIASGMSLAGSIMSNNIIGASVSGASVLENALSRPVAQCGSIDSNNGFGGIQYPYLIFRRPRVTIPSNYEHIYGRPSKKYGKVSSLNGYTQFSDIRLIDINGATSSEIDEIKSTLMSGIIL